MRKKLKKDSRPEICRRIAQVRLEVAGPRGKSAFAKKLGLSPSTYDYYEATRVPPADVLVKIADVADLDLNWLLTGHAGPDAVAADHPVLQRAAVMLADRPNAAGPLAAFVDILGASLRFPAKPAAQGGRDDRAAENAEPGEAEIGAQAPLRMAEYEPADEPATSWIPILGRSAAGVPHFWADPDEAAGVTTLGELIARHARGSPRRVRSATAATEDQEAAVQIITVTEPDGPEVVSFVAAAGIKAHHPDAFALQIDGDSMAPDIRHGDLVVLSPSIEAADGRPAVVQLAGQIGVTCKLFRREGETVHLVPIDEHLAPQTFGAERLSWALRVLARVRGQ